MASDKLHVEDKSSKEDSNEFRIENLELTMNDKSPHEDFKIKKYN